MLLLAGCNAAPDGPGRACLAITPILTPADRSDMVWVPGGETVIGSDRFHTEEAPVRRVKVNGFWIDRHEVTNAQFAAFVNATGYRTANERNGGGAVFRPPASITSPADISQWWQFDTTASWRRPQGSSGRPAQPEVPVVQVTRTDALAYARWRGRNLPSEPEWERAARGGLAAAAYTWGDDPAPPKPMANTWQGSFPLHDTGGDGFARLAPAGCFPPNGYGLHDMAGNAWELTSAVQADANGSPVVIKGGSWLCADNFCLRYRPAARQHADGDMGTDHIGFRTVVRSAVTTR